MDHLKNINVKSTKKRFAENNAPTVPKKPKKTKRVEKNIDDVIDPTKRAENPFIEAVVGLTQGYQSSNVNAEEISVSILKDLYTNMPPKYNDKLLEQATATLLMQMQTMPALNNPLEELSSVLYGTFEKDVLQSVLLRTLHNQVRQVENNIMGRSDDNDNEFTNNSKALEEQIKGWLMSLDTSSLSMTKTAEALVEHVRGSFDQHHDIENLPDFTQQITQCLQQKSPLLMNISDLVFKRPSPQDVPKWSRQHIANCLMEYDEKLCANVYRPCAFGQVCTINVVTDRISVINPADAPKRCLVAMWRPEETPMSQSVPNLCILCYIACINYTALKRKLHSQNFFHHQMFQVDSAASDGFPDRFIIFETLNYIAPFLDVDALIQNIYYVPRKSKHELNRYEMSVGAF